MKAPRLFKLTGERYSSVHNGAGWRWQAPDFMARVSTHPLRRASRKRYHFSWQAGASKGFGKCEDEEDALSRLTDSIERALDRYRRVVQTLTRVAE